MDLVAEDTRGGFVDSQDSQDWLVDRIAGRRAMLADQAELLRKELAEVEAELERAVTAEQVVAQLLAEPAVQADEQADEQGPAGGSPASSSGRASPLPVPQRGGGVSAGDLPGDYQRLLQIVAEEGRAGEGVMCKRVCAKLGLTAEPRHTEGVRVKLKRLVERGWLTETTPGRFSPRS